ncbi:hypothetical protein IGI39_004526 [Enterococcus sp. AZ135]
MKCEFYFVSEGIIQPDNTYQMSGSEISELPCIDYYQGTNKI